MALVSFSPNTVAKSADVNSNFSGLSDGSLDAASNSMSTFRSETMPSFVASGCVWSLSSGLIITMTSGVIYFNGVRTVISSVASHTCGANKDVYIDIAPNNTVVYTEVANNATSPALTSGNVRVAIVVTGASVSSFNQGKVSAAAPTVSNVVLRQFDALGNPIYPSSPTRKIIGYAQVGDFSTGSGTPTQITGLSAACIIPSNTKNLKLTIDGLALSNSATNGIYLTAWDGTVGSGTQVGSWQRTVAGANYRQAAASSVIFTPAATGSKTFNIGIAGDAATTNFLAGNGGYVQVEINDA